MLAALGENPGRVELRRTPDRFIRSLQQLTSGSRQDVQAIVRSGIVADRRGKMVVVRDIPIVSLCEHHVLPFFGQCHVAYVPNRRVLRPSHLTKLIDSFCHRLQVQERLTKQIATTLWETIRPRGVAVIIEAAHLCMIMRGVEKANTQAVTTTMLGLFRTNPKTRGQLMQAIGHHPTP
ncbi:MAG: GTP cyclohydrolase I FolE [Candidatus Methylomirabilales bacterium]